MTKLKSVCVYGGVSIQKQIIQLKKGCDILIATPGRLIDMLNREAVSLRSIIFFCLDEADRLLDQGFEPQIREIIENYGMPPKRTNMFFSASFPYSVRKLASEFLVNYLFLKIGEVGSTSSNITQEIIWASPYNKKDLLIKKLKEKNVRTLIFVEEKIKVNELVNFLRKEGFNVDGIHGDFKQEKRESVLKKFRLGKTQILIATSVAARGLDIENIQHVINFDLPSHIDEYVHRIGRTGRAGNLGIATAFFNDSNRGIAKNLLRRLEESNQFVPTWFYDYCKHQSEVYSIESDSTYEELIGVDDDW